MAAKDLQIPILSKTTSSLQREEELSPPLKAISSVDPQMLITES